NFDESIEKAIIYISENLEYDLSVKKISKNINVSKSVLYKRFHQCFNCTISEFINTKRIEKSIELLVKTDLSMDEVSRKSGFSSASYFGKIFKREIGVSPLKYKKANQLDVN
ncbi:MAG: AraC family transcriptional regulator, partial [Clostridia bacterium]|nr:AraC family transcriptional regulator [Clostridia bacterium]